MSQKRQPEEEKEPLGKAGGQEDSEGRSSLGSHSQHDNNGGPKRQKVPALHGVITEVMWKSSIDKFLSAIEPLIRRVVKEEVELAFANHSTMITSGKDIVPSASQNLQLQFMTKLSLPIFTGSKIEGETSSAILIALVDALTREVVVSGEESMMKVEIVVLEGDFESKEEDNWTAQEFNSNIVREREGKRSLLTGDLFVDLNKGVGAVGELSFTDNSSWTRSRKFRLGARTEDGLFNGMRVKEAISESFVVKDHRGELYKKHHPPLLEDEVWRLEKIGKDGAFHKRLNSENINTVKDFLTLLHIDAPRLRNILGSGMSAKMWEAVIEHARTYTPTDKVHVYHQGCPSKTGVVFDVVGEVRGIITQQRFVPIDRLMEKDKAEALGAVKLAYKHWSDVITCDTETLLVHPAQLFNSRSQAVRGNEYNQFSTQVAAEDSAEDFGLSHLNIPSPDIFSMDVSRTLDACALQSVESIGNQLHPEVSTLGGLSEQPQALEKFSNSLVYDDCASQPSFSEDCYRGTDPSISFDTSDLGAALKGFIATMSKPHGKAYKGWRILSYVWGWIFYTKKVALKRKKP